MQEFLTPEEAREIPLFRDPRLRHVQVESYLLDLHRQGIQVFDNPGKREQMEGDAMIIRNVGPFLGRGVLIKASQAYSAYGRLQVGERGEF